MSDMGADEQDARAAREWAQDVRREHLRIYGREPERIEEQDDGTWLVFCYGLCREAFQTRSGRIAFSPHRIKR